jgi:hypothetical protein
VAVGNQAEVATVVGERAPESSANAAGALVAGRLGCADDMPGLAEIERMSGEGER